MNEPPETTRNDSPIRQAARVLLLDRDGRALLFRFVDPVNGSPFWITPGGGLDEGETFEDAAKRELREETGIVLGDQRTAADKPAEACMLGPCVWTRTIDIRYRHKRFRQHERYFPLQLNTSQPSIDTAGMLDYEVTDLHEHRWWSAADIAASDHRFAPSRLATLIPELLHRGNTGAPIDVGR